MLIGKWTLCQETKLISGYNCTSDLTVYEFAGDSTYKEYDKNISNRSVNTASTRWSLNGRTLTIAVVYKDENNSVTGSEGGPLANITWIDKNHFYSMNNYGTSGGIIYYYFKRK